MPRHAHIEVDPHAIASNTGLFVDRAANARVCAVVKADGYGHGSVLAARAALEGGAESLAVALPEEGTVLREAGIEVPVLLLSEPPADAMFEAFRDRLTLTLYTEAGIRAAVGVARTAMNSGTGSGHASLQPWPVHLKVDTGMHRAGADPERVLGLARRIVEAPELHLAGTFTHLAAADEPERDETMLQLQLFSKVLDELKAAGVDPGIRHAANSAGALRWPDARFDMVRVGIGLYGYSPLGAASAEANELKPALSLKSEVALTRTLAPGESVSYGLRHTFDHEATVAVVPLGYADGIDRRLGLAGGQLLIAGRRHNIRGVVTMDQLIVEVSPGPKIARGDEVVLIGAQGSESITADDWAGLLDTIPYEVVCRFSSRVPRITVDRLAP